MSTMADISTCSCIFFAEQCQATKGVHIAIDAVNSAELKLQYSQEVI